MKKQVLAFVLILPLVLELTVLMMFAFSETEKMQDPVAVNEIWQTVQRHWDSPEAYPTSTALEYVVLDAQENVRYKTRAGLSESIHQAIRHRDTILDVVVDGTLTGRLIVYNSAEAAFQREQHAVIRLIAVLMCLQCLASAGYFLYLRRTVIRPFHKLEGFAERVADGNLDIPLEMDRHNLFGAFTESFDIMRTELKKARVAEAKANQDKKELVAKLSHDIRTPVASIQAASEVGAALATDEKSRETYGQIIKKADQINTLVTNLFSATLEELQQLAVVPGDMKSTELNELLANADYLHRAPCPPVPDCMLFADKLRLQQVFDNLFANSYKYADTDIQVSFSQEDNFLSVCIEDRGGGVDREELPLLKEKFKRGKNAKNIDGAGLGLYISNFCMTQMKGQLDIENGEAGLRVTVRIALSDRI